MARKAPFEPLPRSWRRRTPIEPEWPVEHRCGELDEHGEPCDARVYIVTSQDGDEVVIDVDEMVVRPPDESSPRPVRRISRHPSLRHVGGYRLHNPELFTGWPELNEETGEWITTEPEWLWFATRTTLEEAHLENHPVHSEHMFTCRAVLNSALIPKLTNVAVCGDAAGDPRGKALGARIRKARRIPMREDRLRELARLDAEQRTIRQVRDGQRGFEQVQLLGEFQETSAHRQATGLSLEEDCCSDSLAQVDLF